MPKVRKAAAKPDLDTQALELQDRLERTLGSELARATSQQVRWADSGSRG